MSDGSVGKDLKRLPGFYAAAGVPELWVADARGSEIVFEIRVLESGLYKKVEPNADGWLLSPFLGLRVRLSRKRVHPDRSVYELETQGN